MKKHISKKKIVKYFVEQNEISDHAKIKKHLDFCKECALEYNKLQKITTPFYNAVPLNANLKERILRSYRKIKASQSEKVIKDRFFRYPSLKYGIGFALVLFLLLSGTGYYFFTKKGIQRVYFSVQKMQGNVLLNDRILKDRLKLSDESRLFLNNGARIELRFNDKMEIILAGENNFYINKAYLDENEKKYNFLFNMHKGQVFTSVNDISGNIIYSYKTPQAVIIPYGTRFLIKCDRNKTELYLTEGEVNIALNATGKKIFARSVKKYIITMTDINESALSNKDNEYIGSLIAGNIHKNDMLSKPDSELSKSSNGDSLSNKQPQDKSLKDELQNEKKNMKKELHRIRNRRNRKHNR